MTTEIEIFIDKLYRYDRKNEHCFIGIPLEKGLVYDTGMFQVKDPAKEIYLPSQVKATSRYTDGSIRFVFIRFMADIPANKKSRYICEIELDEKAKWDGNGKASFEPVRLKKTDDGYEVSTTDDSTGKNFSYNICNNSDELFSCLLRREKL